VVNWIWDLRYIHQIHKNFLFAAFRCYAELHLLPSCLTKSDALGLLSLLLIMITGNLTIIKNTAIRVVRFYSEMSAEKTGYYYLVCCYQNTGQMYNTKTGLDKYDLD